MRTDDLDYDLPPGLIAQTAAEPRDSARLLVYDRAAGAVRHRRFRDVLDELDPGDLVVLNDTRVLPVRVRARRETGGAAEVLLLEPQPDGSWEALARPARRLRDGETVTAGDLAITIERHLDEGRVLVRPHTAGTVPGEAGTVPTPCYAAGAAWCSEMSVFAASTSSLRFTPRQATTRSESSR